MKQLFFLTVILLLLSSFLQAQDTLLAERGTWMPKVYLDARTQHPPQDAFWKTVDFSKYLSPVTSLQISGKNDKQVLRVHTYGADNFPITIKRSKKIPGRKEWILDQPVFTGTQGQAYSDVTFSLITHDDDRTDLWLGLTHTNGQKDSLQFVTMPKETGDTPLWLQNTNYLAYYFKGKHFDVYDDQGKLVYNNIHTDSTGVLNGFPGYKAWDITASNTFQLTPDKQGDAINFVDFNIRFTGEDISLQPLQKNGPLNKPLLLKEKPQVP